MSDEVVFVRASCLMRKPEPAKATTVDVSTLPVCSKERGGCGHYVDKASTPVCYDEAGRQVTCTCVCDLYLPKPGCTTCGE
jgi:hypothetical protein